MVSETVEKEGYGLQDGVKKLIDLLLFISYNYFRLIAYGGVAKWVRATGSYPVGQRFRSTRRYHMGREKDPSPGPVVKRLRHRPFTVVTMVQFS